MDEVHGLEVTQCWQPITIHVKEPLVILLILVFVFEFNHHLQVSNLNLTLLVSLEGTGGRLRPDGDTYFWRLKAEIFSCESRNDPLPPIWTPPLCGETT
jgi:hypothetical protein